MRETMDFETMVMCVIGVVLVMAVGIPIISSVAAPQSTVTTPYSEVLILTGNVSTAAYHNINSVSSLSLATPNYVYAKCYQESANTTNQTGKDGNCTLTYTGAYYVDGSWFEAITTLYDGIWAAGAWGIDDDWDYMYVNYTKPVNAVNPSQWQIAYNTTVIKANLTIPSSCMNYNPSKLLLRVGSFSGGSAAPDDFNASFSCYNGTWSVLAMYKNQSSGIVSPAHGSIIDEEAMWWNVSSITNYTQVPYTNYTVSNGELIVNDNGTYTLSYITITPSMIGMLLGATIIVLAIFGASIFFKYL
jgi:hypothetical protein